MTEGTCSSCGTRFLNGITRFRTWWMHYRSGIAKLWLWGGLVGASIGFGFLWTTCNPPGTPPGQNTENDCGPIKHWLGIIFIFMIFLIYAIYSLLKDCNCCLHGFCANGAEDSNLPSQVSPSTNTDQWEDVTRFGLDLPSYEDAIQMPKVEQPKSQINPAFDSDEEPPVYSENDRIAFESSQAVQSAVLEPVLEVQTIDERRTETSAN